MWTQQKESQLQGLLADIDTRNDANAHRFNILHAVGPDGHREIIGLAAEWKCSFEEAVDRYGTELVSRFYGKKEAV